jgi:hypothetical protein
MVCFVFFRETVGVDSADHHTVASPARSRRAEPRRSVRQQASGDCVVLLQLHDRRLEGCDYIQTKARPSEQVAVWKLHAWRRWR